MAAKALAPVLAKEIGKNRKVAYLTPDYTYGHSVFDSMKESARQGGLDGRHQPAGTAGTTDFSSYLLNIANSGAVPTCSSTSPSVPTRSPRPNRPDSSTS